MKTIYLHFSSINGSYHMAIDTIWPFTKYTVIFFFLQPFENVIFPCINRFPFRMQWIDAIQLWDLTCR